VNSTMKDNKRDVTELPLPSLYRERQGRYSCFKSLCDKAISSACLAEVRIFTKSNAIGAVIVLRFPCSTPDSLVTRQGR
jgi:hypothetical protein